MWREYRSLSSCRSEQDKRKESKFEVKGPHDHQTPKHATEENLYEACSKIKLYVISGLIMRLSLRQGVWCGGGCGYWGECFKMWVTPLPYNPTVLYVMTTSAKLKHGPPESPPTPPHCCASKTCAMKIRDRKTHATCNKFTCHSLKDTGNTRALLLNGGFIYCLSVTVHFL